MKRYNSAKMTAQINYAGHASPIKIVAPFIGSTVPLFLFPLIGLIGGIILSFSLAMFLNFLDDRARLKQRLEDLSGVKVISRVGDLGFE